MRHAGRRHLVLALASVGALVLVACTPKVTPGPAASTPTTTTTTTSGTPAPPASASGCAGAATATQARPVEYVAVVDTPGPGAPDVVTFRVTSLAEKNAKLADLSREGSVVAVSPEQPVSSLVTPSDDPSYLQQWGLANAGFPAAWANGEDGTGETIAVIDTGVDATHEDLAGKVLQGFDFTVVDQTVSNYGRIDFNGHGTHVAGIAAATDNTLGGVGGAPGASILPVRVLSASGSGWTSDVVSGIYWAADHGANVISMSLGGSSCGSAEHAAVAYAKAHGVVVVAAAGNNGTNVPIYPAGFDDSVIAVGATTQANAKASFSNWGTPYVDIGAPGSEILSTYHGGYANLSGTSMATPFVAAAAALVLEQCPGLTPSQVQTRLMSSASPVISGLGASLVQAGAATNPALGC